MSVNWRRYKTPLRWVIGIGILIIILMNLSIEDILSELLHVSWVIIAVNVLIKLAIRCVVALKWYVILRIQDRTARFWPALAAHFAGTAVSSLVPFLGADLTVGYAYYRQSGRAASAVSSILMDRALAAYVTVFIATLVLIMNWERFQQFPEILNIMGVILTVAIIAPFGLIFLIRQRRLLLSWWMPAKLKGFLNAVRNNFEVYRKRGPQMLLVNLALALVTSILRILSVYTLALAVGAPGTLLEYAVVSPIMFLMVMVPAGQIEPIVLEQGVFIVMLGLIGVSGESAFAMSVINRVLLVATALPGLLCILKGWGFKRNVSPAQEATPGGV
jgi:uncharacterized protein (TIRG00374 family)